MAKLINCKTCNAQIASSAKKCPACGAKNRKPARTIIGSIFLGIAILLLLITLIGPKKDNGAQKQVFGVGESAELNGIVVTLKNTEENTGEGYNKPSDGMVFILCSFEIENNSQKEISISSLMSFNAYVDDYSTSISLSAQMVSEEGQLDGNIAPGKKMVGAICYEVPSDWKKLEISLTPDFWSGKDIGFLIENN